MNYTKLTPLLASQLHMSRNLLKIGELLGILMFVFMEKKSNPKQWEVAKTWEATAP